MQMAQTPRLIAPSVVHRLAHASVCSGGGVTVEVMLIPPWASALLPWAEEGSPVQIFCYDVTLLLACQSEQNGLHKESWS